MKINLKKNDKCPICNQRIKKPNCWVNYHIRYKKPLIILACKYCNLTEFLIRNEIIKKTKNINNYRIKKVINFQKKFNIKL